MSRLGLLTVNLELLVLMHAHYISFGQNRTMILLFEDFKLEKGPTDKAKEPDPGGSDQQIWDSKN